MFLFSKVKTGNKERDETKVADKHLLFCVHPIINNFI